VIGEEEKARRHFKAALRFAPKHSIANHLLTTLDAEPEEDETPAPPATVPDPLPPLEPAGNLAAREGQPG